MRHAVTEHRDFRLLEADFRVVQAAFPWRSRAPRTSGRKLSAWMFHGVAAEPVLSARRDVHHQAARSTLLGAAEWGGRVARRLGFAATRRCASALPLAKTTPVTTAEFAAMLRMVLPEAATAAGIVRCARSPPGSTLADRVEITSVFLPRLRPVRRQSVRSCSTPTLACTSISTRACRSTNKAKRALLLGNCSLATAVSRSSGRSSSPASLLIKGLRGPRPAPSTCTAPCTGRSTGAWRNFALPQGQITLILRHLHIGTEIRFIKANARSA